MDNKEVKEFFEKYEKLQSEKSGITNLWQEIAEFCYPNMSNFERYVTNHNPDAMRQHRPIYDVTAEQSLDICASSLMSLLCNPASKWLMFEADDNKLNESHEVQVFLDDLQELCLGVFNDPKNRFYDNIFLALKSICAFGISPLLMEKNKETVISFKAETPKVYNFEEDFQGNIVCHYLEYEYSYNDLKKLEEQKKWSLPSDLNQDEKHIIIRKIELNKDYNPKIGGYKYAKYQSCYYHKSEEHKLFEDFFNETPIAVGRWDKINGTKWNDSPARVALSDTKMLNQTQRDTIIALEKLLNPPLAISSESQIGKIDLSSNAVMVVQGDARGAMAPVHTVGDVPSIYEWQQTIRESIRTSFFIDIFMTAHQEQMTLGEAQIRYQEKLKNIAPKITRLQTDLLGPCVQKVAKELIQSGAIEDEEGNVAELFKKIKIKYVTPVSNAYRQQEAVSIMGYLQNLQALANIEMSMTGQSSVTDNIDFDMLTRELAEITGIKTKALLPKEEVEEIRVSRQEAQQEQSQLDKAEQLSNVAKNIPNEKTVQ